MNSETAASKPPKILVVDDNAVIQVTVSQALKKAGYQVLVAGDISKTLTTVRRELPDLILLDLAFPIDPSNVGGPSQDGLFVIEWLHRTPETEKIPIIIISGADPATYKEQASRPRVIASFRKPLNHEELLAAIKSALAGSAANTPPISPEI